MEDRSRGHARYHRPAVEPPADEPAARAGRGDAATMPPPSPRALVAAAVAILAASLIAWLVPLTAVVLVWPILFFVPGWVVIRRVAPDLPLPGAVGAAFVASVYVSAHLVNVVARVGGFGRGSIIVSAALLALGCLVVVAVRHRWLAPLQRPTWAGFVAALRADLPAWIIAIAIGLVVLAVLGINGWSRTPDGWVSGGWNWSDLLVHVAIGSSISAGNFPPEVPYFAGVPLTYHWFADFHGAIASTVAGLDIIPVYFASSALFAGVLALVVWALAKRLTGDRRVATIATILVVAGGGLGWIRLVGDVIAGGRRPGRPRQPHLVRQHVGRRLAVLQDRVDLRDRVPPAPGDDARPARACHGRAPGRPVPGSPAAGRPAGRRAGRAARAVPVLRLPGDLPDRLPVRRDERCVARANGRRAMPCCSWRRSSSRPRSSPRRSCSRAMSGRSASWPVGERPASEMGRRRSPSST